MSQVIKNLIIANVIVYVAAGRTGGRGADPLTAFGALVPSEVWVNGHFWTPLTYMWLHAGLMHIGFNSVTAIGLFIAV